MPNPSSPAVVPRLPVAVGLVFASLSLAAVFLLSLPDDQLWKRVVEDSGHGPVFACLAVVLLWMQSPRDNAPVRSLSQYRGVFVLVVALGVVTELLQHFMPHRNVSARDVLHDAAGAALGLALAWIVERSSARRMSAGAGVASTDPVYLGSAVAVALAGFVVLAWQPLQCARAYAARAAAWPALLPMGEVGDDAFVKVNAAARTYSQLPATYARSGDRDSLRLSFSGGVRPGIQVLEPTPDWRGMDTLVIDVTNPSPRPVELVLRIHDRSHDWTHADRFNQPLVIPAAARTTVHISLAAVETSPRGRRMDMAAIANVMLFARRPVDAGELYLTRVWLE